MNSAQRPAITRSVGRRLGARYQQLVLEEERFGDNGTSVTAARELGDRGDEMDKQDG